MFKKGKWQRRTGILFSALRAAAVLFGLNGNVETLGEKTKRIVIEDRREIWWGEKRGALRLWSGGAHKG